jgi:hypothetical protein
MTGYDTEVVSIWLSQDWPAGAAMVGGCDSEGQPFCRQLEGNSASPSSDDCWRTLNEAIAQLTAYDCGGERAKWVFETAIIFTARRSDGAWAGIVTPRELPQTLQNTIDSRLEQFVSAAE